MEINMAEITYEMVICIVNAGYSDTVMEAAKAAGARGGTVLHARGTANKEAEAFFQISIEPEKDLVMMIVPSKIKDAVLHEIYQKAGLNSNGQGIAFSLPVDKTVGLGKIAENAGKTEKASEKSIEK